MRNSITNLTTLPTLVAIIAIFASSNITASADTPAQTEAETDATSATVDAASALESGFTASELEVALDFIKRVYGADSLEEALSNREALRKARQDIADKRFVKGCFFGSSDNSIFDSKISTFKCSIRGSNDPNQIAASRPASVSYTINNDGDDSYAVAAATKVQTFVNPKLFSPGFLTFSADWQKNNQQKKEQDNLSLGASFEFDQVFESPISRRTLDTEGAVAALEDFASAYYSFGLTYNRKGVFGDPTSDECEPDPTQPFCGKQDLESLRLLGQASPYLPQFESKSTSSNYWVFSPSFSAFYDTALNDDFVSADGKKADGEVTGFAANAAFVLSPGWADRNRWEFALTGQYVEAVSRSKGRRADFEKTSRLFSASLNYALSSSSFVDQKSSNEIIPILSLTYTNGSDSLKARESQDTLVLGLSVKY